MSPQLHAEASARAAEEDESDARAAVRDARAVASTAQAAFSDTQAAVSDAQQRLRKWMDSNLPEGQIYMEYKEILKEVNATLDKREAALKE
ncbi:hypothetical protein HK405_006728, partial [Cladochytrium tenue]